MIQIAAFWRKESKNNRIYYTGKLGSARLLLFQNTDKKSKNSPDLILYVVEDNSSAKKEGQQKQTEYEPDVPF